MPTLKVSWRNSQTSEYPNIIMDGFCPWRLSMTKINDLIKKELEEEFVPKFQELSKGLGIAPAGGSGGNGSGKPPMPPGPPKPKMPTSKKPKPMSHKTLRSVASGSKAIGKPNMMKDAPKEGDRRKRGDRYHIYQNGQKITTGAETVTLDEVNRKHGGVKNFESKGFRLVQSKKEDYKKNEEIAAEVMAGYRPMFLGDIKDLAKSNPRLALAALPLTKGLEGKVLAGVHVPNIVDDSPKSSKLKGKLKGIDAGSGGQVSKDEFPDKKSKIPANKIIKPKEDKDLEKDDYSESEVGNSAARSVMNAFGGKSSAPSPEKVTEPKEEGPGFWERNFGTIQQRGAAKHGKKK